MILARARGGEGEGEADQPVGGLVDAEEGRRHDQGLVGCSRAARPYNITINITSTWAVRTQHMVLQCTR